jgi:hypothetical protein
VRIQYWQVSGYEATADIDDEPSVGGVLHRGTACHDGAAVWVFHDRTLGRWQEVDPALDPAAYPSDDLAADA